MFDNKINIYEIVGVFGDVHSIIKHVWEEAICNVHLREKKIKHLHFFMSILRKGKMEA